MPCSVGDSDDESSCGKKGEDCDAEQGISRSIKYICCTFLDDEHYTMLHQSLSQKWSSQNSLAAAVRLMEQYGVEVTQEDLDAMSLMDEAEQINCLVAKMPQQSNEQFQHFFLQLQLLVSTASRLRRSIEEGQPDEVEQALNDADSTGICQYILKMAIVQAGAEVASLRRQYEGWVREADVKMGKLVRGQEDAMQAQKKLAEAQGALQTFVLGQSDRIKKVLTHFATGSDGSLRASCFHGWSGVLKQLRTEREIHEEYEERLTSAKARLMEFKASQLASVRRMMQKKAEGITAELVAEVLKAWHDDAVYQKDVRENAHKVEELENKLKEMAASQAANSKKVLERMNAGTDSALKGAAFSGWLQYIGESRKEQDMAAQVAEAEKKMVKYMEEKAESAKKVMQALFGASESGCLKMGFDAWRDICKELRQQAEEEEILANQKASLNEFSQRSKKNSHIVMEKASVQMDHCNLLRCMNAWRLHTRMERTLFIYHAKIEAKKAQLVGVQQMFRNFANQLESGLREGGDTARELAAGPPHRPKRGMQKTEGSVSLPDINARHGSSRVRTPTSIASGAYMGQDDAPHPPKHAW